MATLEGVVEDESGSLIGGATVIAIRESDGAVAGVTMTDSSGEFSIAGLGESETFHVAASYNDGSTDYGGGSFPFVEPFVPTGPIDDFEDNDISEYGGDTVSFDVQSGTVHEGSFALSMTNDDGSSHEILSTSGLPRYPSEGGAFSFRVYFENENSAAEMHFGVQDSNNLYRARIIPSVSEISIDKRVGGSMTFLDTAFGTIPIGEWLEGVVDWDSDSDPTEISFTLNDASGNEIAATSPVGDEEFSSGGIGWDGSVDSFSGDSVYYDIAELTRAGTGPAAAIIDNFEDGDLSEYTVGAGNLVVTSDLSYEGANSLTESSDTGDGHINSTSGLNDYPEAGDTFEYRVYFGDPAGSSTMRFALQDDTSDGFNRVYVNKNTDEFSIRAAGNQLDLDSVSIPTGEWLRVQVEWSPAGEVRATLYDSADSLLSEISGADGTFVGGGVGFYVSNGNTTGSKTYVDLARITEFSEPHTTGIIDGFEDGDLSEYIGVTSGHTIEPVGIEGDNALKFTTGSGIASYSGLPRYPRPGDTIEWRVYLDSTTSDTTHGQMRFGSDDTNGTLFTVTFIKNDSTGYTIRIRDNPTGTNIDEMDLSGDLLDEWMRFVLDWGENGNLVAEFYDSSGTILGTLSGSTDDIALGGIGIDCFSSNTPILVYFDDIRITNTS